MPAPLLACEGNEGRRAAKARAQQVWRIFANAFLYEQLPSFSFGARQRQVKKGSSYWFEQV
jgi:hypothetical protein